MPKNKLDFKILHAINEAMQSPHKEAGITNHVKFELVLLGYDEGYCSYANLKKHSNKVKNFRRRNLYIQQMVTMINQRIKDLGSEKLGRHQFCCTEWLYDIHWYNDVPWEHYMPQHLHLAAECEFGNKRAVKIGKEQSNQPYSAVKYDFQKLLVTNARLRLMIFRVSDQQSLEGAGGLSEYFGKAIQHYKQLAPGSRFLFACFVGEEMYFNSCNS